MARNVEVGHPTFSGDLKEAVDGADAVFIVVGTPTHYGVGHAKIIKYAASALLAIQITSINEIAILFEHTGANVKMVSKGLTLDGRIGHKFLHAGLD